MRRNTPSTNSTLYTSFKGLTKPWTSVLNPQAAQTRSAANALKKGQARVRRCCVLAATRVLGETQAQNCYCRGLGIRVYVLKPSKSFAQSALKPRLSLNRKPPTSKPEQERSPFSDLV